MLRLTRRRGSSTRFGNTDRRKVAMKRAPQNARARFFRTGRTSFLINTDLATTLTLKRICPDPATPRGRLAVESSLRIIRYDKFAGQFVPRKSRKAGPSRGVVSPVCGVAATTAH